MSSWQRNIDTNQLSEPALEYVSVRIHVISDIHLECQKWRPEWNVDAVDCDVHVLAGDIGPGLSGLAWALQTLKKPTIYVPGNHEFWSQLTMIQWWSKARERAAGTHVHLLSNEAVIIDGIRFLGTILWTDYCLFGSARQEEMMSRAQRRMADFANVFVSRRGPLSAIGTTYLAGDDRQRPSDNWTPQAVLGMHQEARDFIERELARSGDWDRTVVVTHHAPSAK